MLPDNTNQEPYFAPTGSELPSQRPANSRPIHGLVGRIPLDHFMRRAHPQSTVGGGYH